MPLSSATTDEIVPRKGRIGIKNKIGQKSDMRNPELVPSIGFQPISSSLGGLKARLLIRLEPSELLKSELRF